MSLRQIGETKNGALDQDDAAEYKTTKGGLIRLREKYGIRITLDMVHDPAKLLASGEVDSMDQFWNLFNGYYRSNQYMNMPFRASHVRAIIKAHEAGQRLGAITKRPEDLLESLAYKYQKYGIKQYVERGFFSVPSGQDKGDVMAREGFDWLVDDHPRNVFAVANAGPKFHAYGISGHRPWNSLQHYLEVFGGVIPPNVTLVPSFQHALDPGMGRLPRMPKAA